MNTSELLDQTERASDIFSRIIHKMITSELCMCSEELSLSQFKALKHIARHGMRTIGYLAVGLSITQPAATTLVDRLVIRGLAERRPGKADRRQSEVVLTDRGRALLEQIEVERAQRLAGILEMIPAHDREQLVESLERFIAAALKSEQLMEGICLRCGCEHDPECIVNQMHIELAGKSIERV